MAELRAQFTPSIRSGIVPLEVTFVNQSSGPYTSVRWDFGDGITSNQVNPTHQYLSDGVFPVTLTIFDDQSGSTQTSSSITVYSEVDQTASAATQQQALFTHKRFTPGQVNVIKRTQVGSVFSSQTPMSSSTNLNIDTKAVFRLNVSGSTLDGVKNVRNVDAALDENAFQSNYASYSQNTYFALILAHSGQTSPNSWSTLFDYTTFSACPVMLYKGTGVYASNTWTADRPLPNINQTNSLYRAYAIMDKWSGGTNFTGSGNQDFLVPRMQIAIDSYGSLEATGLTQNQIGKGTLLYLGYDQKTGQTIAAIGPFNSAVTAVDSLYPGTFFMGMPWIMWHKSTTPGIKIYDSADATQRDVATGLRYRYLRDGLTTSDNIVGRIFYDKKFAVIDDEELVATLTYTSNRNWTLPQPNVVQQNVGGGWTNSAITYYVTYRAKESSGEADNTKFGLGGTPPVHCRYIQKITPSQSADLRLDADVSRWFNNNSTINSTGFSADAPIEILIGTGTTTAVTANSWRYSATSVYYSGLSNGITIDFNWDNMTDYQLDSVSGSSLMTLGSEWISLAYISGNYESNIYKLAATCVAKNTEFNTTQNDTFNASTNESVYITEAALYNENNELLMIGKLSEPIEKNNQKYVTVKLEIDI